MRSRAGIALAFPAWAWLVFFFVIPVGYVVWYSFGYKPGIFGTHANDVLSFDRYLEVLTPTFFATFQNTLWIGIAGTLACLAIGGELAVVRGQCRCGEQRIRQESDAEQE